MSDTGRINLAVRREGGQVIVVARWREGDRLPECIPDGEWADAGSPVEIPIAMELLARMAESAPEPLAATCARIVAAGAEAVSRAVEAVVFGPGHSRN